MNEYILVHHGIKGQKWGKMNGPPYPLGSSPKSRRSKAEQRLTGSKRSRSAVGKKRNSRICIVMTGLWAITGLCVGS